MITKTRSRPSTRIDKSVLRFGEERRERCEPHLKFLRLQRCCVPGCGRRPCAPHHLLTIGNAKGRSIKNSDWNAIPLCHDHHLGENSPHGMGSERRWAERNNIDLEATVLVYQRRSPAAKRTP